MERPCGLLTCENSPVPLKSISVKVEVKGFVANVSASLEYQNNEPNPLEAIFVFPMDSDSAVYNFQAVVDEKTIMAEIKEKEQAKDDYDDAISSGQQAFLFLEDESSSDIFTCCVGNLPPGQSASVSFSLVQELELEAEGIVRFTLPTVLNPRYTPAGVEGPKILKVSGPKSSAPYTLSLDAEFHSPLGISRVQSNCQVTPLEFLSPDKTSAKLSLVEPHSFDRDVELLIYYQNIHEPSAILEAGQESAAAGTLMGEATVMLQLFPSFPSSSTSTSNAVGEFVFLLDRSNSMAMALSDDTGSSRIQCAKDTLLLLLKSLPMGCYFNIYGFGSNFESFFPESVEYSQSSMKTALDKLKSIDADMGGTEILQPLSAIYSKPCVPGHPRQLFVFSDGEVSNTRAVLAEVQKNASNHRCFSFGIGDGVSTALIKGIAKAASGNYEFITGKERMQPKVLRNLRFALQVSGQELTLNWDLPPSLQASLLSQLPTVLFNGQRIILYAQLKGKIDAALEAGVILNYSLGDQLIQSGTRFSLTPVKSMSSTIHRLAAKAMISALELGPDRDTNEVKKQLVQISTESSVVSSRTAFVAINKDLKQPLQGSMRRRNVPLFSGYRFPPMNISPSHCFRMPVMSLASSQPIHLMDATLQSSVEGVKGGEMLAGVGDSHYFSDEEEDVCYPIVKCEALEWNDDSEEKQEESMMLKLIALQNADGSWGTDVGLEPLLGLKLEQAKQALPRQEIDLSIWLTILAVIWLHHFAADSKNEWEFLVDKAISWIKAKAGPDLAECVNAGNNLLKTTVGLETLGL